MSTTINQPSINQPSSGPGGPCTAESGSASASLERALTEVARAIIRLSMPTDGLGTEPRLDRAGYWLLVRVSEQAPVRISELADAADLDLSTVSRQVRDLVDAGLVDKVRDPLDGRASLLSLTPHGAQVLESVSEARRVVIAEAVSGWTEVEQEELAERLRRFGAGLPSGRQSREAGDRSESSTDMPAVGSATGSGPR
jgi:DNA-binding MarR family transcriptional regulator